MQRRIQIILAALALDWLVGDPPNRFHPVAWMGRAIGWLYRRAPKAGQAAQFAYGGGIAVGGTAAVGAMGYVLRRLIDGFPMPLNNLAEAWLLKTTFTLRGLDHAAGEVEQALRQGNLPEARRLLSWHLVSRDTSRLDAAQVAAAAIESVAENTSDGIVAPLLAYLVGSLPAALAYRYANTADAMLGYHDPAHEWLGKVPARLDDLFNLIPARLTGVAFVVLRPCALPIWWRDAQKTASPNAGHPMSAMAGALGVTLEKVGHYRLNEGARPASADDIRRARRLMIGAVGLLLILLVGLSRSHDA